jgi:hypothetical protein
MIKSFQTTGSGSEDTDFSLSNGGSSNTPGQQSTNLTGEDDFLLG